MAKQKVVNGIVVKKSKMPFKRKIFIILMMFVPFWVGVVYTLYMKFRTISMMFSDQYGTGFGLYWIKLALGELEYKGSMLRIALKNVFMFGALFNVIAMPLQVAISFFFYKKIPFTKTLRIIYYLPNLINAVISAMVFRTMFDTQIGPITRVLIDLGVSIPVEGLLFSPSTAYFMVYVYCFWIGLGNSCLLTTASMLRIPQDIRDAMLLDGVGYARECVTMVVPLISPILSVMFLTNVMNGFGFYGEVLFLTNPQISHVYTVGYILSEGAKAGHYYEAAGRGAIVTLIAIPTVLIVRWVAGKILPDVSY